MAVAPQDLANMVKNGQFTQLREYGGADKLAQKLSCFDANKGLDPVATDFNEIQRVYGKNELEPPFVPAYLSLVWEGLQDLTIMLLLVAAIVSLVLGVAFEEDKSTAWIEGAAILVAVAFVVNFQAWTDYNNARTFRKQYFELESAKRVHVVRGGELQVIHPRDLVVGDVLRLEAGSVLPADGVLIEGRAIKMDESALTGESKLMEKTPYDVTTELTKEQKASPFMLSGTSVVNGTGRMLVVAVGINSLQGQILAAVVGQDKKKKKTSEANGNGSKTESKTGAAVGNRGTASSMPPVPENQQDVEVQLPGLETSMLGSAAGDHPYDHRLQSLRNSQFSLRSHRTLDTDPQITSRVVQRTRLNRFCCKRSNPAPPTGSDDPSGGTLTDKLDNLAVRIGKVGALIGLIVFIVMCIRWAVEEFGEQQGVCNLFDSNATICQLAGSFGCSLNANNATCDRVWHGATDISTLLRFFITAITILVVVVPEGLPLAVTLSLSLSMRRMAKDNNQVKNMDSSETMGSATTICTDKTGTLTENRMTCVRVFMQGTEFKPSAGHTLGSLVGKATSISDSVRQKLRDACSLATSPSSSVDGRSQKGNATDCALLRLMQEMEYDWRGARSSCTPAQPGLDWGVFCYPFSSSRKRSSIVVANPNGGYRVYSVGAPQYIMDSCVSMIDSTGAVVPFEGAARQSIDEILENYAHAAMRTICIGYRDMAGTPANGWETPGSGHEKNTGNDDVVLLFAAEQGLTLLSVMGIEDPLRSTVIDAVKSCYTAGVDVRMCTGDSLETATAISLQCGILRERDMEPGEKGRLYPKECFAMTGAEFDERIHERDRDKPLVWRRAYDFKTKKFGEMRAPPFKVDANGEKIMNMKRFDEVWPKLRVLSRCLPEDKLTLVRGLRRSELFKNKARCLELEEKFGIKVFPDHQVVAVTGDGTNDAPALKAADVGFAMGIVGTDIAKQACDIILLDDNFASIVTAIKWGRNVFDCISKFVQFQLTVNLVAIVVACVGAFGFNRSPLGPVQMLWVNLIMDSFAAFALATDPPSPELLDRPPYGKKRPIVSMVMLVNIFGQGLFQVAILMAILFNASWLPDENWQTGHIEPFPPPEEDVLVQVETGRRRDDHIGSIHWTIIFNTFVMLQLANQFNSRKLQVPERLRTTWAEWNVFKDIHKNPLFIIIFVFEFVGQVIIVQFGDRAFFVRALNGPQWAFCIGLGLASFPWQIMVNLICLAADILMNRLSSQNEEQRLKAAALHKEQGLAIRVEDDRA